MDRDDESVKAGWGPLRNLLASDQVSEFPSFNLDKSDEVIGDERGLYGAREDVEPPNSPWKFTIDVEPDKTYLLRVYVHNSAADAPGMTAEDTRISVNLPTCTGRRIASGAFITSTNAAPSEVYGGVNFVSDRPFNLVYVEGSARICNNFYPCNPARGNGAPISNDFLASPGALIGYDSLNGEIPGGWQHALYFGFKVRPQFAPN